MQLRHSRRVLAVVLAILGLAASEARAQQTNTLQRANTLYQKAQTAYEKEQNEAAIDHLEQIEELLADRSGPAVDTLRARRLALLARAQYRTGELGGAQRAHIKMTKTGAVPPALATEMAEHRKQVEVALMEEVPRSVRSSIRRGAAMDTLDLSGRGLIGLPDSIGRLSPRKRVDLSDNELPSLPRGIGQWTEVQKVDVSDNRLGCVPESIGRLSRLEELDLSGNRLTELPDSIGQLTNLRRLDLGGNDLSEYPNSLNWLTRLRRLDLSGNSVSELPSSIGQLNNLRRLDLSSTLVDSLPFRVGQFPHLKRLDVPRHAAETEQEQLRALATDGINVMYPMSTSGTSGLGSARWLQTARLEVELDRDDPVRVFLDTLTSVLARRDTLLVRRSPDAPVQPFSELKDRGVDSVTYNGRRYYTAATHVRIDYIFGVCNRGFEEEIQAIQFFYRSGPEQALVPLLSVDGQKPWIQDILQHKGIMLPICRPSLIEFRRKLRFARLVEHGKIVKIANQPVREGFERKKQQLIKKIRRLMYENM